MGCLVRLGCLCVLLAAAVVGWFTRDHWMPARLRDHLGNPPPRAAAAPTWRPLSEAAADSTKVALGNLNKKTGKVYETLSGAAIASYIVRQFTGSALRLSTDSIEAIVVDDRVELRASVPLAELGGAASLPGIGSMVGDPAHLELSGTLHVIRSGLAEYEVQDARVHGLSLPRAMIPSVIKRFDHGARPVGLDADGLPLPIPPYVGDIRVANGKGHPIQERGLTWHAAS